MHKIMYSFLTHIPVFGALYKVKTSPMLCSMGMADGEYDFILKLIEKFQKLHPNEQVTKQVIEKLVKNGSKL